MHARMRGMALVEMLVGMSVFAVLLGAALPLGRGVYARVAVHYEAMRLVAELRRVQAISRTTATALYVLDRRRAGLRAPLLVIRPGGYDIHHHTEGRIRGHDMLPLVRIEHDNRNEHPVAFESNGEIAGESSNMTIRVYAAGKKEVYEDVVIDRAARIRLARGTP